MELPETGSANSQNSGVPLQAGNGAVTPVTPWQLLMTAISAVPVVKYALGLVGIAAAFSIVRTLPPFGHVSFAAMGPIFIGMIVVMAALALLSLVFVPREKPPEAVAQTFLWAVCLFVIALMIAYLSALIFGVPKRLAVVVLPEEAAQNSFVQAAFGDAEGYAYYGMQANGQEKTDSGKLTPLTGTPYPHFGNIKIGEIFQTSEQVHLHTGPSRNYADVKLLDGQECVIVTGFGPQNNDSADASGGWLKVRETSCKKSGKQG